MITLEEDFSGRNMDVSHFSIFRTSIHYHVSKELRKKLELTIELGVFLGYTETPHNYYVYLSSLRMKVVQTDVNFYEEKAMWFSLERELQIPPEEEILAPKEFLSLKSLRDNPDIVILRADKGGIVVILDKSDYVHKMVDHLSNSGS